MYICIFTKCIKHTVLNTYGKSGPVSNTTCDCPLVNGYPRKSTENQDANPWNVPDFWMMKLKGLVVSWNDKNKTENNYVKASIK